MHYKILFFTVVFALILAITSPEIVFGYADDDVEILVSVDKSSYKVGDLLNIKGTGAHSYTVFANIISPNGDQIVELMFIAAKSGDFATVWIIPRGLDDGTYIIQIKDVKKQAQTTFDIGNITKLQNSSQNQDVKMKIPDWVRNNAKWWAQGVIGDAEFILGIQFLVKEEIIIVPQTSVGAERQDYVPDWIKNNAKWWAEGAISEDDFLNGIQYLIKVGIVSGIDSKDMGESKTIDNTLIEINPEIANLKSELEACQEIKSNDKRLDCEKPIKAKIELLLFKEKSTPYQVGPITFYYPGIGMLGNEFELSQSGQALLTIWIMAENTGSNDNVVLMCTGPSICNYDVWNGQKAFKYSSTDFVSGQIVIKPGDARKFNMLFGPNIGYGGTTFEYDSSKEYFFRISEPWGKTQIPLNLDTP